jgi:hypothetical protein
MHTARSDVDVKRDTYLQRNRAGVVYLHRRFSRSRPCPCPCLALARHFTDANKQIKNYDRLNTLRCVDTRH